MNATVSTNGVTNRLGTMKIGSSGNIDLICWIGLAGSVSSQMFKPLKPALPWLRSLSVIVFHVSHVLVVNKQDHYDHVQSDEHSYRYSPTIAQVARRQKSESEERGE
jgi:hypothetical protein